MNEKFLKEIEALTAAIENNIDNTLSLWELYYQRGYLYFLNDEDEKAKDDYKHAQSMGLDATEIPFYAFSNSNSKRRDLLLPEKIMIFLVIIMVLAALAFEVIDFVYKVKSVV